MLCAILYGDLEREVLQFCSDEDSLLLRLVDDFLFITLDRSKATRFLTIMYDGLPEYGAKIGLDKCLVNFETSVNGNKIPRLEGTLEFPYCGNTINTKTLGLKKDLNRRIESCMFTSWDTTSYCSRLIRDLDLEDTLTVTVSKNVGRAFHQKIMKYVPPWLSSIGLFFLT